MQTAKHSLTLLCLGFAAVLLTETCARAAEFEQARWIAPPANRPPNAPCPLFRKEFALEKKPKEAMLRIIGLGDYEVRVDCDAQSTTLNVGAIVVASNVATPSVAASCALAGRAMMRCVPDCAGL